MKEEYVIFLNGVYAENEKEQIMEFIKDKIILAADGGANFCYNIGIIPKYIIGDLDSIKKEVLLYYSDKSIVIKTDSDKDYTDFELCLKLIENQNFDDIKTRFIKKEIDTVISNKIIYVFGATGNRVDMTLTNLKKLHNNKNMIIISEKMEKIKYLKLKNETYKLKGLKNKLFSIIPITDLKQLDLKGFVYNLDNKDIDKCLGLASNIVKDDIAYISCLEGEMYIIYE